jgi:uncharacterized hydrophobic protein (TIGR00271 family)
MEVDHGYRPNATLTAAELVAILSADSLLTFNFMALTLASCAIATFGLLENNVAVIIGAMIVAPFIAPIGSVSFGVVDGDGAMWRRGVLTLAIGTGVSIVLAALLTSIVPLPTVGSEIMARSQPNLLDLGVALAAGLIAAFAKLRPSIAGTVAGTAIAVAIMPPICVVGIAVAHGLMPLARGALLLFLTNLLGIMLASMVVYVASGHVQIRRAGHGLIWTIVAVAAILIPLGASTGELIRQARVESTLRGALLNGTVTFQRVELVHADFDWVTSPPTVRLLVRSAQPITPTQVRLLEDFAAQKTHTRFQFVFDVSQLQEVDDQGRVQAPNGAGPASE